MPENEDVYYLRGINKFLMNDYEGAISDFDSLLILNPNHSDGYLYRAKSKKAVKDYWGAMKDYNKAKDQNFSQTVTSLAGDVVKSLFSK
jgi:tetratricopeptide (TPR) repeat protein